MNVQLDTNLLTRLAQPAHTLNAVAHAALRSLETAGHTPCIVPQNLYEFWAVATRPLASNGLGMMVTEAKAELDKLKQAFILLPDTAQLIDEWEKLVVAHDCKGKPAHDARIVAAMNVHGVTQLLTFNAADFARYPSITLLDPAALAASQPGRGAPPP